MRQCPRAVFTSRFKATAERLSTLLGWKSRRAQIAWQGTRRTEACLSKDCKFGPQILLSPCRSPCVFACWQASCLSLVPPFPSNCVPCLGPDPRPTGRLSLAPVSFWSSFFEGKGWQKGRAESYEVLMHVLFELNGALKCSCIEYRVRKKKKKKKTC